LVAAAGSVETFPDPPTPLVVGASDGFRETEFSSVVGCSQALERVQAIVIEFADEAASVNTGNANTIQLQILVGIG
jgi:hypothetical protein